MKRSISSASTAQILTGIGVAAAAWLLLPRQRRSGSNVVLITGGSRGLGLALAHRFGKAGARLVLAARNPDELQRAQAALLQAGSVTSADHILLVPADLTDPAEAAHVIEQTYARFSRLDVLINNAGIIEVGPFENQPLEAFHRAMDTNFYAALHTIQAALPRMLAQEKRHGRRASIVNISSIGGKVPVPHLLPYVASKFALTGLSEGLHAELRQKGIRVTTVCPGLMRTGSSIQASFTGQAEKEFQWFSLGATTPGLAASSEHAANRIYNATASGCAEITITPQAWLAARIVGLAPAASQFAAALANHYLLPSPPANPTPLTPGAHLKKSGHSKLEQAHNQA
jgi:NAD(P)-dependent dehydrogenase (short-subunit alcohol dehydrogenase family)